MTALPRQVKGAASTTVNAPAPCKACGGKGWYFDANGHGGFNWKRPCHYCRWPGAKR